MAEQAAVVVAAGRDRAGVPVSVAEWATVRETVARVVERVGTLFTRDAVGVGEWEGQAEESVTVAGEVEPPLLGRVFAGAEGLCTAHRQQSVAVTVGVTVLVQPYHAVDRVVVAERLRALAAEIEAGA